MSDFLLEFTSELDQLSKAVADGQSDGRTVAEIYGLNCPAITSIALAKIPLKLSEVIKNNPDLINHLDENDQESILDSIDDLKRIIVPHLFNSSYVVNTVPAFLTTMQWIKSQFEPMMSWEHLKDSKAMPKDLARRLRYISSSLEEISLNKDVLESKIHLINDATAAAESLPTDLQSLKEARLQVASILTDSITNQSKIKSHLEATQSAKDSIESSSIEADKLVQKCEEAYKITTTQGLAASFTERAKSSNSAMWWWVAMLVLALISGSLLGGQRIKLLSESLSNANPEWSIISMHIILSLLSVGAPLWFAWIATKQINQRFRLSEDYAFKASVARAYEGYKAEAARLDPAFEARLFNSALTRLEEAPLRLVDHDNYGSPWQEFFSSPTFQRALDQVPELKNDFIKLAKQGLDSVKSTKNKPASAIVDSTGDED